MKNRIAAEILSKVAILILLSGIDFTNSGCIFPECDESGALSMCYKRGEDCPKHHYHVKNDLICNRLNMQCCRSYCAEETSICYFKSMECPEGYIETTGNWTCPHPEYKCCSVIDNTI